MPRTVGWIVAGAVVVAGIWLASRLADLLLVVAVALLLTAALLPVVRWLQARRVSHTLAVVLCFVGLIGLVAGAFAYVIPLILQQGGHVVDTAQAAATQLDWARTHWRAWRSQYPALLPSVAQIVAWVRGQGDDILQRTIGWTGALAALSANALAVLALTFFFLKDGRYLLEQILSLVPWRVRREAPPVLERVAERIGAWVQGQLLLMAAVGGLTLVAMWLIGMPYAVTIAVIAGLLEAVPYLGPVLSAIVALMVAVTVSWHLVLWTLVAFVGVQLLENNLLQPLIMGRSVGLHPAWVILAVFAGGNLLGLIGMILAVPVAAVLKILIGEVYLGQRPAPVERGREAA
jgi:predicted PurR-regulated permease PerM